MSLKGLKLSTDSQAVNTAMKRPTIVRYLIDLTIIIYSAVVSNIDKSLKRAVCAVTARTIFRLFAAAEVYCFIIFCSEYNRL